jgi:hypothetical protein
VCVCGCVYVCEYMRVLLCANTFSLFLSSAPSFVYLHTHTRTHTHTHTHTHPHPPTYHSICFRCTCSARLPATGLGCAVTPGEKRISMRNRVGSSSCLSVGVCRCVCRCVSEYVSVCYLFPPCRPHTHTHRYLPKSSNILNTTWVR